MLNRLRCLRIPHVRGNRIDAPRRVAADWVRSAILVAWALIAGVFLIFNGHTVFQRDSYRALVEVVGCLPLVGGALFVAGILGLIGEWFAIRWATKAFYLAGGTWHGLYFGYTLPGNLGAFGNMNMVSMFALLVGLLYAVQLIEIWPKPTRAAL